MQLKVQAGMAPSKATQSLGAYMMLGIGGKGEKEGQHGQKSDDFHFLTGLCQLSYINKYKILSYSAI